MGLNMDTFENYKTPGFDELFMRMVYLTATKSKDPSSKIGLTYRSEFFYDKNAITAGAFATNIFANTLSVN